MRRITMTSFIKKNEIKNNWLLINAENIVVGRLAAYISKVLRGKDKSQYTPHMDNGDFIIVTNIDKIKFSGKKMKNKKYYKHTGYPGGIKETNSIKMKEKNKSTDLIKLAIKRMIPSGPLGRKQLSNCKIYHGIDHKHEAQNPIKLDIQNLNSKNILR